MLKKALPILIFILFLNICYAKSPNNDTAWTCYEFEEGSGSTTKEYFTNQTGNLTNTPTWTTGYIGNAINYSRASNEYTAFSESLAYTGSQDRCIISWIKWGSDTDSPAIMMGTATGAPQMFQLFHHPTFELKVDTWAGGATYTGTPASVVNSWNLIGASYGGGDLTLWKNGSSVANSTQALNTLTAQLWYGRGWTNYGDVMLDQVMMFNTTCNNELMSWAYNSGAGRGCEEIKGGTPTPPTAPTYWFIYASEAHNQTHILNYNITTDTNSSVYYSNGVWGINTSLLANGSTYNVNVYANGYYTDGYIQWNTTYPLYANLSRIFNLYNVSYQNYTTYSGLNWSRELIIEAVYTCNRAYADTNLSLIINGSGVKNLTINCDGGLQKTNTTYKPSSEYTYSINVNLNTTFGNKNVSNYASEPQIFKFDLYAPTINYLNFTIDNDGFGDTNTTLTMQCNDTFQTLLYNMTWRNISIHYSNETPLTTIEEINNSIDGDNILIGYCSDLFNTTSKTVSRAMYVKYLYLIDERLNTDFDINNISSAKVYFDDNSSVYDFQANNISRVNFSSDYTSKLRFELGYSDGAIVTRYVDTELGDANLRVCANTEGVTHYEQLLLSALQKEAILKNVYSNCVVAADYTRFAYQDSYVLKAYTIDSMYYLSTKDNGKQVLLASVDGSIQSYINLDVLEFSKTAYNFTISRDALTTQLSANNQTTIYYKNLKNDNTALDLTITRLDSDTIVLQTSDFDDANEFTLIFNYATLDNINDTTVFQLDLTRTTASSVQNIKQYFTANGVSGLISSMLAFVISAALVLFGMTITISRASFSWFGIIILLAAIALLALAIPAWYVTLLMSLEVILMVYAVILMWQVNYNVVT